MPKPLDQTRVTMPGRAWLSSSSPWRIAIVILVAATVLRLSLAAVVPLFPDEAYYWVWSRQLAGGYFDHPPAIALLIRAGAWADSPFGVRFVPVLAGLVATLATAATARRLAGDRAALWVAVITAGIPLAAAGLILATPDAPLIAATSLGLYAVVRALEHAPRSTSSTLWWAAAGLALGMGLLSKFSAAIPAGAVFVALLARADLRPRLLEPGPYLAIAIAAIMFMPVVLWNADHRWVSFYFQLRNGLTGPKNAALTAVLNREGDYLGGMVLLASPILFCFLVAAVYRGLRRDGSAAQFILAMVAVVTVGFFGYSALHRRVEANWPAPAYLAAIVLLATFPWQARALQWIRRGLILAFAMSLVIYAQAVRPVLPIAPARDPMARSAGWDTVTVAIQRARESLPAESRNNTWVAADRYQDAALMTFHDGEQAEAFSLNLGGRRNQYDLWPGFTDRAGEGHNLILVVDDVPVDHSAVWALAPYFGHVRRGELVTLRREGGAVAHRRIWLLVGWKGGWPPRPWRRSA